MQTINENKSHKNENYELDELVRKVDKMKSVMEEIKIGRLSGLYMG